MRSRVGSRSTQVGCPAFRTGPRWASARQLSFGLDRPRRSATSRPLLSLSKPSPPPASLTSPNAMSATVRLAGPERVGAISRGKFERRIRELADGNPMLEIATEPMLRARATLRLELTTLEKQVRQLAQNDPVCRRLMTMPGVGAVVALTYRSAVDDPARFTSSKRVGPWVGLTPSRNQSGERDVSGGITKAGDVNLRQALCQAATVMMNRGRSTWLRTWGAQLAKRRGRKRAMVALARRIAVILHRIWVDGTVFQPDAAPTTA